MHPRITESNSGIGRSEQHVRPCLVVRGVRDGTENVPRNHAQSLERPNVADRIGALVSRAQCRPLRECALMERYSRVGLDCMAENVQPAGSGDLRRQRARVFWVDQAERWFQPAARNSSFCVQAAVVEDAYTRRLTASARSCWYRNKRLERPRDR